MFFFFFFFHFLEKKSAFLVIHDIKNGFSDAFPFQTSQQQFESYSARSRFPNFLDWHSFKGPYADHILIPPAQLEVVYFLYQMKVHIFLIANPKFQLQILCSFGDITKSMKLNGIPENN